MKTVKFGGTDKELYEAVAPMVMDPKVIRANNGYAYKTSKDYTWYVAMEGKETLGFVPVKHEKSGSNVINNYYIKDDNEKVLEEIISRIGPADMRSLTAVVQSKHEKMFGECGFKTDMKMTKYVKMTISEAKIAKREKETVKSRKA